MATSRRSSSLLSVDDPIVAPITPPGLSSVAGLRLSGTDTLPVIEEVLGRELEDRRATKVTLQDIDTVVAVAYRAPHSYTGEDVVEIFCHGNPLIVRMAMKRFEEKGFRLAHPGEFTFRAVVHGKMDLLQAEAVRMIIHSDSPVTVEQACRSLTGLFSREVGELRTALIELMGRLQAVIEFPEDNLTVDGEELAGRLREAGERASRLLESSRRLTDDDTITVAILGPPNVGKSTLFNALLGEDRAIVTTRPGTTRDEISETILLEGIRMSLVDTAGLRETEDPAERQGVERARRAVERAQALIYVVDGTSWNDSTRNEWEEFKGKHRLLVWNKADLEESSTPMPRPTVTVSALTGRNVNKVLEQLTSWVEEMTAAWAESTYVINERQRGALTDFVRHVKRATKAVEEGKGEEEVEYFLREGVDGLQNLLGEITPDDVMDYIFGSFCLGK